MTADSQTSFGGNEATKLLAGFITQQTHLVRSFIEVLKQEQSCLTSGQLQELDALTHQKEQFISQFARHQKNFAQISPSLSSGSPLKKTWDQFLGLMREARELNELNGRLLAMRLNYNQQALQTLQAATNVLSLYDQTGLAQWGHQEIRTLGKA